MILRTKKKADILFLIKKAENAKAQYRPKTTSERRNLLENLRLREKENIQSSIEVIIPHNVFDFYGKKGVYFLLKNKKIVYIGSSECIISRIAQHIGCKDFDSFKILIIEDQVKRLRQESDLIKKYSPIYNLSHNPLFNNAQPRIIHHKKNSYE